MSRRRTLALAAPLAALLGCFAPGEIDQFGKNPNATVVPDGGLGGAGGGGGAPGGQGGAGGLGRTGPAADTRGGCADGTREGFLDEANEPDIAGCAGAFDVPGVTGAETTKPACGREAGDDGVNPSGKGCTVEDLCAPGFHVCISAAEVVAKSKAKGCDPAQDGNSEFWLTRQSESDAGECGAAPAKKGIVGCGTLGSAPPMSCAPLLRVLTVTECLPTAAWYCGDSGAPAGNEALTVRKTGLAEGGVLCCRN